MRNRTIKKYGNTWVIKLETIDIEDFGIIEGDKVDIEDIFLELKKVKKNDKRNG